MQLEGKSVLVTGAARGMGRATAERAAGEGARVAVADLALDGAEAVARGIRERGGEAVAIESDVGDLASINAMVDAALAAFGAIDVLVNNAGITRYAEFMDVTEADWDAFMRVNAKGGFFTMQRVAREMVARGQGGRIINMASIAGKGFRGTSNAAYAATKGAVIAFTYQGASALAQHGINVNAVCPGPIDTDMSRGVGRQRAAAAGRSFEEQLTAGLDSIPLGRMIPPEDVARMVVFLMGPGGYNITGQTIHVDAGVLMS